MELPGVTSFAQMIASGATRRQIDAAVRSGAIWRLSKGWYEVAGAGADPDVALALRLKGRAGCLTGCRLHGLWVPPGVGVHVAYGIGSPLPSAPAGDELSLHLHASGDPQPRDAVWPLLDCLEQVILRHATESALVVVESALHLELVSARDVLRVLQACGRRGMLVRRWLAVAESGSETRVRLLLQRRGVNVRPQVPIAGVGRVDLRVGRRLVIECDSVAHHTSTAAYETDRARDLAARDQGFDVIRLTYRQVWLDWPRTRESLIREVRRRRHEVRVYS